jgi:curli biogenesis system outer membrane secretion channel CsgG
MWVENQAPNNWGVEVPVSAIEDLLTSGLFKTNRFDLVERKNLQAILAEQHLGASGAITPQTAAKVGKALGAAYLIFASVNEWTPERSNKGANSAGMLGKFGLNVGAGKAEAEVAMTFRIVDATTGQVTYSETQRARAASWGLKLGGSGLPVLGGLGGSLGDSSPISYAVQSCINKVAYKIVMKLKDSSWRGSVADVDGSRVYINAGSGAGIQVGMKLTAMMKGKTLEDPETGLSLGEDLNAIGTLQITTVQERFSVATILQGCKGLKKGDRVEFSENI